MLAASARLLNAPRAPRSDRGVPGMNASHDGGVVLFTLAPCRFGRIAAGQLAGSFDLVGLAA